MIKHYDTASVGSEEIFDIVLLERTTVLNHVKKAL